MESARRPFDGLKVIDCASFIAAPAAATILSDFGAQVLKIEPLDGDPHRALYRLPGLAATECNYPWELDSRNKLSLAIDLKRPEGLDVLHRLARTADVFITNLPLAARRRLGIDHESIRALNPRLVYASFTAYGETGPEADKSGFDSTAYWARSGLMDVVKPDHSAPPARSAAGMGDHPSSMSLFAAIVTALYERQRTGVGGLVSSSLLANGLWANSFLVQGQLSGAIVPQRVPREQAPNPLGNTYRCRDGRWLNLSLLNEERQFGPLLEALGCGEAAADPRFSSAPGRAANNVELVALMDRQFAQRDLADWRVHLDAAGITFGVVGTLADIDDDVQMRASGALVPFSDGSGLTVSSPFEIAGTSKVSPRKAPAIGQHTESVMQAEGFGADEIARLRELGVIGG
ncbi:MAG TPA: CoA transferase [Burkholderiaceae bacterium]|jgi:formyl-CoA transferase|nr:CoA transferase [Burkholderiaceae bacterium]